MESHQKIICIQSTNELYRLNGCHWSVNFSTSLHVHRHNNRLLPLLLQFFFISISFQLMLQSLDTDTIMTYEKRVQRTLNVIFHLLLVTVTLQQQLQPLTDQAQLYLCLNIKPMYIQQPSLVPPPFKDSVRICKQTMSFTFRLVIFLKLIYTFTCIQASNVLVQCHYFFLSDISSFCL